MDTTRAEYKAARAKRGPGRGLPQTSVPPRDSGRTAKPRNQQRRSSGFAVKGATAVTHVLPNNGQVWIVREQGRDLGPFPKQAEAEKVARDEVSRRHVEVRIDSRVDYALVHARLSGFAWAPIWKDEERFGRDGIRCNVTIRSTIPIYSCGLRLRSSRLKGFPCHSRA
jgi:hypothetical protein